MKTFRKIKVLLQNYTNAEITEKSVLDRDLRLINTDMNHLQYEFECAFGLRLKPGTFAKAETVKDLINIVDG